MGESAIASALTDLVIADNFSDKDITDIGHLIGLLPAGSSLISAITDGGGVGEVGHQSSPISVLTDIALFEGSRIPVAAE